MYHILYKSTSATDHDMYTASNNGKNNNQTLLLHAFLCVQMIDPLIGLPPGHNEIKTETKYVVNYNLRYILPTTASVTKHYGHQGLLNSQ